MKVRASSSTAFAALAVLAACGCGARERGLGVRGLAPFGVRAGWIDFRDFDIMEVDDRPLGGVYVRVVARERIAIELAADVAVDTDAADERQFYAGSVSVLFFPLEGEGGFYLHAGGGAMGEANPIHDYIDGFASGGVGIAFPAGATMLDFRATVWQMIDSGNVARAGLVTLGCGF